MKKLYPVCLLLFFSISLTAQQLAPSIQWQKCLGGSGDDIGNAVLRTSDNGLLVVGSSKSNNGDVSGHHGSPDSSDAWVVKLSLSGDILWQRSLGGNGTDVFKTVTATDDGNFICVGTTRSNDGDVSGLHGGTDIWMVKIDRNGNIIWKKCFGGSGNEETGNLKQNLDGSLYFIGTTFSNNGDVSGNHSPGLDVWNTDSDAWVVKLRTNGDIIWQKCFGGTNADEGYDINELENGNFLVACQVMSIDGTFGALSLSAPVSVYGKLDSTGKLLRRGQTARSIPCQITKVSSTEYYFNLDLMPFCYPINPTSGARINHFTYNPSETTFNLIFDNSTSFGVCAPVVNGKSPIWYEMVGASAHMNINGSDNILALSTNDSLDNSGYLRQKNGVIIGCKSTFQLSWKKFIGGTKEDHIVSVTPLTEFEFVVAGYTKSNDGDVSGNHGGNDIWVVRMGQTNTIKGTVYLDYNANGTKDANEPLLNNLVVQSQKGSTKAGSSTYKGVFSNSLDTGIYSTSVLTPVRNYSPYPASKISNMPAYNTTDSISFAMQPVPGKRDYQVQLFCTAPVRPGFNNAYRIVYMNIGTDTLVNKTIRLIKDPHLQFLSALPAAATVSGDTISWLINRLNPRDTGTITYQTKSSPPPALNFGDFITSSVLIDSTADLAPLNNLFNLRQYVTGAYDPNDKQEGGGGFLNTRELADNKYLQYTIRFQNTGNDTAFNISVRDTLSAKADWSSIEMVASSHPYELTIKNGNQLTWSFNNILLADSVHNEPLSHGYIVYRVKPATGVQAGDSIKNTASIYFDFNPPVKTNEQLTIIKASPGVPTPVVTGVQNSYCNTGGVQKPKITNLPQAGNGISASVKLDATVLAIASDSTFSFDPAVLTAGTHHLVVTYTNNAGSDSTVFNFIITAAVTPDVNLSANITSITNLTAPVTITASNAAGGGNTPLYTFASDRNFASITQPESSNNLYNVNTSSLPMGDNWIFVKMKTSATCYTAVNNIDSIKLNKLLVPGQPVVTGLASSYCGGVGVQKIKITNLPAANYLATTTAKLDGVTALTVGADSTITLQPAAIAAGNHTIVVAFTNASGSNSTTINFFVTQASTPDVNLSANPVSVVNNTDPVIITATNASGGGTSPKYVFAKDKAFTDILQAESNNNVLTLQNSALVAGANKVFVQMKTSDTCFISQTATDSMSIVKNSNTRGISDADFPNQLINAYPNPFGSRITVNGLQPAKAYSVIISNAAGAQVHKQQISNSSGVQITTAALRAGKYWLSVYDVAKNKLIGSFLLVKQ